MLSGCAGLGATETLRVVAAEAQSGFGDVIGRTKFRFELEK